MFFKLRTYNREYYEIYKRRREVDWSRIPSFRWIRDALDLKLGEKLLDAGCGDGGMLKFLCSPGVIGVGLDLSDAALEAARTHAPQFNYLAGDLTALPFESHSFDKIVCFNVIEHIHDQERTLDELKRVLRPGGRIVLGTNIRDSICWWLYQRMIGEHTHTREFTYDEFRAFTATRFSIVRSARSSGVFRAHPSYRWIFHKILLGDVLVAGEHLNV